MRRLDYRTIRVSTVAQLDRMVNFEMHKGYKPIGSVYEFRAEASTGKDLCQTMIRKGWFK